jgi:hypothetical protein
MLGRPVVILNGVHENRRKWPPVLQSAMRAGVAKHDTAADHHVGQRVAHMPSSGTGLAL